MRKLVFISATSAIFAAIACSSVSAEPTKLEAPQEAEVYLLAGQSNMQGVGQLKELPADAKKTPANVFFWNGTAFEPLIPGKTKTSVPASQFGPEIGFAAGLTTAPRSAHPIYLIKFHLSGQPLHYGWKTAKEWIGAPPTPRRQTFYPGKTPSDPNTGLHYLAMRASFTKALAVLDEQKMAYKVRGIVWMQGEADAKHTTAAKEYGQMLRLLKTRLEQDLKTPNLPLVYGQVLPYSPPNARFVARDEIRARMQAADHRSGKPDAIPGAWMVPTDDFPLRTDHVHYNTEGQWRLGNAFAKAMQEAQAAATAVKLPDPVTDTLRLVVGAYPGAQADLAHAENISDNIVADPDWFVWGGSVIEEGGKYHMFAERWPKKYGFDCWLTHAEIAQYVADRPEGPFRFMKTVLTGRGKGHWDQIAAYNPNLCKFNGKYYLYYVSTQHPTLDEAGLTATAKAGGRGPNWKSVRNAQRTGLAVADSLDGPWQRADKPVIEPHGAIARVTVNPAVCQGPDGRYHMIVKGDHPAAKGWGVFQAVAVADKPEGPWQIQPTPAFSDYNTEDACLWYDSSQRRYYAVVHVCDKAFMAMITSDDGIKWEKAAQFKLMPKQIPLKDGSSITPSRMERPFVLTDARGNPRQLYLAILASDRKQAYNLNLKLERRSP